MFTFILQIRQMIEGHPEIYLFAVYSAIIWLLWVIKVVLSSRYRPFVGDYATSTSVVVPVVDEPVEMFRDVIDRMVAQRPSEIIVVINGAENPALVAVCEEFAPLVRWTHTPIPGKRNAVKIGTRLSTGEITVLVDSDTVWSPNTLSELVKPFRDQRVGGVTTRQRILDPTRSWITRWADWLENSRALYSMPAQSVLGHVGCLPGRTIAFRRSILMQVMHRFMTQRFMGVFLEVSDDRTLTNLTLKAGYRTVYQYTSLVYTDAPLQIRKLFKQQLRWARGSQYNTLRMLPWMLGHAPMLAFFFVTDILMPFILAGVVGGWIIRALEHSGDNLYLGFLREYGINGGILVVAALMLLSSVVSMAIRQMRHLSEKPSDFLRLPLFIIVSTFFLMPVRLLGFFRMAHASGWGTRAGAYSGGMDDPGAFGGPGPVSQLAMAGTAPSPRYTFDNAAIASAPSGGVLTLDAPRQGDHWHIAGLQATRLGAHPAVRGRQARRRYNVFAAIPYLIGFTIFALEAMFIV